LVAEEVLEDSCMAISYLTLTLFFTVYPSNIENLWWDLKKAVAARKPKYYWTGGHCSWGINGLIFLRNAARCLCLVIHLVCSRSLPAKGCSTKY